MADTTTIPENLRAVAQQKGWPDDLLQQALAAGATPDQLIGYMNQGVTADQARQVLAGMQGGGAEPSPAILAKAQEKGWPEDLVRQALSMGAAEADLINYMDMGVTAEQARQFMAQGGGGRPQLDLSWMDTPTEWNTRARPTKHGLTLEAINIGKYGEVPDEWPYQTEMPRGAVPIPGVEGMGYSIFQKQEVWSDACARLYEEAIQRRWRPATDVPWESIQPLPDDLERAIDQICTHISEKEQLEADVLGRWEPEISYGYHEVKLYLATTIFENARAAEVFRKRALSNGGGLGVQSTGWAFRAVVDARNFTEMVAIQMVLLDSLTLAQYQFGEAYAKNPAERFIFSHCLQDKARHIAYGITHLKYVMNHRPDRREEVLRYLDKGEMMLLQDDKKDPAVREAFAIYFGGSTAAIADGMQVYRQMRKRHVEQYLARLKWATLDRGERLAPGLRAYLEA
ncbi:MAG TPA: hypothetical protein VNM91_05810 [Dehalococcoidia bacterium]|nr:hypothetical protein [Dehalococcoidia bacterium]